MKFYHENGKVVGLYDVCRWWLENFPDDIFVHQPSEIVAGRAIMRQILEKGKQVNAP